MILPALFFFLRIALAIYSIFCSILILGLFFLFCKKCHWNLYRDCNESVGCFGSYGHFSNTNFSSPWAWNIFPLICVFLISFISDLQFSVYKSFTSMVKFIPRYFILFDAVVNGIVSLISLSDISLLVYRKATDFCIFILILHLYWICLLVLTVFGGIFRVFYV